MPNKTPTPNLIQRLLRYSAVAGLATAGALHTGPGPVAAETTIVVPDDPDDTTPGLVLPDDQLTFAFDFGQDGIDEFTLSVSSYSFGFPSEAMAQIGIRYPNHGVSFLGTSRVSSFGTPVYPFALSQGDPISAGAGTWAPAKSYGFLTYSGMWGHWTDQDGFGMRYLGVRYQDNMDQTHYGWVELTVTSARHGGPQLTVHRYGWDTTPDEPIPAAVRLSAVKATSGLRAVGASAFAALAGVVTWLRHKIAGA